MLAFMDEFNRCLLFFTVGNFKHVLTQVICNAYITLYKLFDLKSLLTINWFPIISLTDLSIAFI